MITIAFYQVIKKLENFELQVAISEKLDEVTSYFQKSYTKGEILGCNNRAPLLPLRLRNHSKEAPAGLVRTTNAF